MIIMRKLLAEKQVTSIPRLRGGGDGGDGGAVGVDNSSTQSLRG